MATLVAVVSMLAGCGDDDTGLSRGELLEQGNAICASMNQRTGEIAATLTPESSPEEFDEAVRLIADESEQGIAELRELEPPDDLADEFTAALDQAEADLATLRDLGGSVFEGAVDPFDETNQRMTDLGLNACAGSGV